MSTLGWRAWKVRMSLARTPAYAAVPTKPIRTAADFATSGPLNNQLGMLGLRDHALGLDAEYSAGPQLARPVEWSFEQKRPECVLQRTDLHAKGRLDDVQATGGAAKVTLFGNGQEVAQLS